MSISLALPGLWYAGTQRSEAAGVGTGVGVAVVDALLCPRAARPKAAALELLTSVAAKVPGGRAWLLETLAEFEVSRRFVARYATHFLCACFDWDPLSLWPTGCLGSSSLRIPCLLSP